MSATEPVKRHLPSCDMGDDCMCQNRPCAFCRFSLLPEEEIIIHGAMVCRPCSDMITDIIEADRLKRAQPEIDTEGMGDLIATATRTAHEHVEAEERGELVSLVTAPGGTVKDPLELKLYEELKAENLSMCTKCYGKGWRLRPGTNDAVICDCPFGRFYEAKTGAKHV